MPPATTALILISVVAYLIQMLTNNVPIIWLGLWPLGMDPGLIAGFGVWQLVTYAFLHGDLTHLLFNMLAIFMFGSEIERLFGTRWYLTYFTVCVVTAGIAQLIVAALTNEPPYPTIGASGGVFGVLLAFGMYFPNRKVMLIFPPIPMPAWLFVTGYGVLELVFGVTGTAPGIAHFAHLGGMVGGFLMILWRRKGRWPRRRF